MNTFLAWAALMSAIALALVLPPLVRGTPHRTGLSRRAANAAIHADELALLDRERSEACVSAEAHQAARDEVLRRLLAEESTEGDDRTQAAARLPAAAITLIAPLVAVALYLLVGNPGVIDASTAAAYMSSSITVPQLEAHLRHAPRDGRAWITLGRLHMEAERYGAAVQAYEQALASTAKIAIDAGIWCELADALGMAQGGTLRGRPRDLVAKALALNPDHPRALELAGSAAYEAGQYAETVQHWTALLRQLPADTAASRELGTVLRTVRLKLANATESH